MNNYFIDSTIWIEFFKGRDRTIIDFVTPLIDEDRIFYNGIILNELLLGAITGEEFNFLKNNFDGFNYLETDRTVYEKSAEIGFRLKRKRVTVPLTDLIIATQCLEQNLTIATKDEHFKMISDKAGVSVRFFR